MRYLILFFMTLIPGCEKKIVESVVKNSKPILIKVEAEHLDGDIITSPVVVVR